MNGALVAAFVRQRLMSPIRMALIVVSLGFPLLLTAVVPGAGLQFIGTSLNLGLILGAGAIGQDLSAGVLQLLFARPLRRSEYVASRWFAVGASTAALTLLQTALAVAILSLRELAPGLRESMLFAGQNVLLAFGVAAVLVFFSTLVGGLGDLGLYLLTYLLGGTFSLAGQAKGWPVVSRIGQEIGGFLSPHIELAQAGQPGGFSWFALISYLSTITLCLVLAIAVMNRRELSYAAD